MPASPPGKLYDPAQDGWEVLWSRQLDEGGPVDGQASAVAGGVLDGRDVVVAAGPGGIAVWDAAGGERLTSSQAAAGGDEPPMHLAVVGSVSDPVAVTGDSAGSVRVWDLRTGLPQPGPLHTLSSRVVGLSAAAVDDRVLALVTMGRKAYSIWDFGFDGGAEVWDVRERRHLRTLRHHDTTTAVALAGFGGRFCAAVAGYERDPEAPPAHYPEDAQLDDTFGSLAVFDALTGEPLGPVTGLGRNWHATALALGDVAGRLRAFAASDDHHELQVVHVAAGQVLDRPSWPERMRRVVMGGPPNRPLVLVSGRRHERDPQRVPQGSPRVLLWDPQPGETRVEAPLWWGPGQLGLTRAGQVIQPWHGEVRLLLPPRPGSRPAGPEPETGRTPAGR
jgi:hypothetical protein